MLSAEMLSLADECTTGPDLPRVSASSDMIRWSRLLPSHKLDTARSYCVLVVQRAGITEWPLTQGGLLLRTSSPCRTLAARQHRMS